MKYLTVSVRHGKRSYAVWSENPLVLNLHDERFEAMIVLRDETMSIDDLRAGYEMNVYIGERMTIPDRLQIGYSH